MLGTAQSRNDNNGNRFVSVTSERDLATVGRPGWTAVAGIARQPKRFLASNQRCIDSGVVCAIAVAKCDLIAVRRKSRGDLKAMEAHQRHTGDPGPCRRIFWNASVLPAIGQLLLPSQRRHFTLH